MTPAPELSGLHRRGWLVAALVWCLLGVGPASGPASATEAFARTARAPDPPAVTAAGAVLWDPADDKVLFGVDERQPRPMASTTKIMTVLLALEAGTLDDTVAVSAVAAEVGRRPGAATLNLSAGDQVPMRSLLAGLILRSGNDAAVAVAEHVSGSEDAFTDLMNRRAAELGLDDTRFVNASGLTDDPRHAASPVDLARLGEAALGNRAFRRWSASAELTLDGIGRVESRNLLLTSYPGATGIKTGYTNLAGLCLVASARRDGRPLVAVVLDSTANFVDAQQLLDYGYTAFRRAEPLRRDEPAATYRWADAQVELTAGATLGRTVAVRRSARWRTVLEPDAPRPLPAGAVLGVAELLIGGAVAERVELRAAEKVSEPAATGPGERAGNAVEQALRAFVRLQPVERAA